MSEIVAHLNKLDDTGSLAKIDTIQMPLETYLHASKGTILSAIPETLYGKALNIT